MSATIADVASLWKLALVGLIFFALVIYRKPLTGLLEKGTFRVRRGNTEVAVSRPPTAHPNPVPSPEGEADAPPTDPDEADEAIVAPAESAFEEVDAAEGDDESRALRILHAVRRGDRGRADEVFTHWQESAETDQQRLENRVVFASIRAAASQDASALTELTELTSEPSVAMRAKGSLADIYNRMGFPDRALDLFNDVLSAAVADVEILVGAAGVARSLRRLDRGAETYGVLYAAIAKVHDEHTKRRLFVELADQHQLDGDWLHGAIALDKAAELAPNDASLRFRVGYAFARADYDDLALMHYKVTLAINEADSGARNNLGVAYEALGMPILAVASYRQASSDGSTLAAANFASRLINGGFIDEAHEVLSQAASAEDAHRNVALNMARLPEASDAENEKEQLADDRAQALDIFFREYGSALIGPTEPPSLGGAWILDNGAAATVEQDGTNIRIDWTEGNTPQRVAGRIAGQGMHLSRYVWEYSLSKRESDFVVKDDAYGYFIPNGEFKVSVCSSSESRVIRTFRRAS